VTNNMGVIRQLRRRRLRAAFAALHGWHGSSPL